MNNNDPLSEQAQHLKLGRYRHFKGHDVHVIGTARHTEDPKQEFVVYYHHDKMWIRPLGMFLEDVDRDGYAGPRFRYLGEWRTRIGIIGSMQHTEKMLEVRDMLNVLGHDAFVTNLHGEFIGKTDEEKEVIKIHQKNNMDAIREFWHLMQGADAVLVLNLDKKGIKNYIGGNTLMEMGFAHVLNQKIFLFNQVPDIEFYRTEIEAMKPIVINGDLSKII